MRPRQIVKENIANVLNPNSNVVMASVFPVAGDAITKMIVVITVTNSIARASHAKMEHSNVNQVIA